MQAIENLMKKQGKFDYVLLETTGLADPAPIASIFWMDEALCSSLKLDGIITMVRTCLFHTHAHTSEFVMKSATGCEFGNKTKR